MNNRDVAIEIYNRLNQWSHGALTDFAVGIIEDELDMAFAEDAKNSVQQSLSGSTDASPKSPDGDF